MEANLSFQELHADDAKTLSALLRSQRADYLRFFTPFPFEEKEIAARLAAKKRDHWWGIYSDAVLVGLVMLRGWDEGYERPSFGVFISEASSKQGLARKALQFCISWCRTRHIPRMMLKVESENHTAAALYLSEGFQKTGVCEKTGQDIMEINLQNSSKDSTSGQN